MAHRRDMIKQLPYTPCRSLLEPHADRYYSDSPRDVLDIRDSVAARTMAYRIGNSPSSRMRDFEGHTEHIPMPKLPLLVLKKAGVAAFPYLVRRKLS